MSKKEKERERRYVEERERLREAACRKKPAAKGGMLRASYLGMCERGGGGACGGEGGAERGSMAMLPI
jgi:hypothetical protein